MGRKEFGIIKEEFAPNRGPRTWRLVLYSDNAAYMQSYDGGILVPKNDPMHPNHPDFDANKYLLKAPNWG